MLKVNKIRHTNLHPSAICAPGANIVRYTLTTPLIVIINANEQIQFFFIVNS
jgi:hypothetical protein